MKRYILSAVAVLAFGNLSQAEESSKAADKSVSSGTFKDVETLMDKINLYDNKKVSVTGEVKDLIGNRSYVLESGGIFNDEITVVNGLGEKLKMPKEDAKVTVFGTIKRIPVVEIRRELSWDLDPQMESELQDVKTFLVAEQLTVK